MILNIIGTGNVGQTLGYLLVKHQLVQLGGVYNRTQRKALDAIDFIGQGVHYDCITDLPHAHVTLLTTPDDFITESATAFAVNKQIRPGDIVFHCSGTLSSDCLRVLKEKGCYLASVHPMKSFKQPAISVTQYAGAYCAMEGDEEALAVLEPLFTAIGSIPHRIKKEKKALYHAAAVFASNYLITLSHQALNCLMEAGVDQKLAMPMIVNIMQSTLTNLATIQSPRRALTGPAQRGDIATIELHLSAFTDEQQKALYKSLLQATLAMVDETRV